ncbi:uncharacterized protein [Physcomitrium patens]|uniref:uncharacterized protein n=1 Tax=Physcomitrium patens TaxID=3218 RepID=UPI003CCE38D3
MELGERRPCYKRSWMDPVGNLRSVPGLTFGVGGALVWVLSRIFDTTPLVLRSFFGVGFAILYVSEDGALILLIADVHVCAQHCSSPSSLQEAPSVLKGDSAGYIYSSPSWW